MTIKKKTEPQKTQVEFRADAVWIEGNPHIILCASVFYFRIPREEWNDRLEKVKAAGYNCIETYLPWNYHETQEGTWEFEGEKDITAFLAMAAELGLWVIARPGPYICSEWDMGALPAYLLNKEGIVLRDYNEVYLQSVKRWYDRILPKIADYQLGKQGTVIAVQIENELDFYDCKQVEPYIATLRDFAVKAGIVVPIFACAGQCDIVSAGGLVEGVLPTINLYPEVTEKELEDRIRYYVEIFRVQNLPACITETGSKHFILRRELISGAKLIAPYNQVCGTNFGFTTAVNNWGKPLSYLPHDYDLSGMIGPRGEETNEYREAFLFTGLVHSLSDEIALSWPEEEKELQFSADCRLSNSIHQKLCLPEGGKLIGVANIDDNPGEIHFTYHGKSRPAYTKFLVQPIHCPIIPFDIPLSTLGIKEPGSLRYSTAEIGSIRGDDEASHVMFYTDAAAEIAFELADTAKIDVQEMDYLREDELIVFTFSAAKCGTAVINFANGRRLHLYAVSREEAINQLSVNLLKSSTKMEEPSTLVDELDHLTYRKSNLSSMGRELGAGEVHTGDCCKAMEELQFYQGYGWYEGKVKGFAESKRLGYMIYRGMDIVHLYRNEEYISTILGDGTYQFIPEEANYLGEELKLGVRCEIWGHSNFSDSRLPAMDIRSKKGILGLAVIKKLEEISENWYYCKDEKSENSCTLLGDQDKHCPRIKFGSYNNPEQPQFGVYKKKIRPMAGSDAMVLNLAGLNSYARVYIDGEFVKVLQPLDSGVSLDEVSGREEFELAIYYEQKTIQESGQLQLLLYEGLRMKEISCSGANEKQLVAAIAAKDEIESEDNRFTELRNERLTPGEISLYSASFPASMPQGKSLKFSVSGSDAKVLVLFNGRMIGRLWLSSEQIRPVFKGGNEALLYLPKSYFKDENRLDLLVEAMLGEPEIVTVSFEEV